MTEGDILEHCWNDLKQAFGLDEFKGQTLSNLSERSVHLLIKQNLYVGVLEYLQSEVEKRLRVDIAPVFWQYFKGLEDGNQTCEFQAAVNELYVASNAIQPMILKMDLLAKRCNYSFKQYGVTNYQDLYWLFLKGSLHAQLPSTDYRVPIRAFYTQAFHVFHNRKDSPGSADSSMEQDEDDGDALKCEGCENDQDRCMCNAIMAAFHDVNKKLMELKLLERITGEIVTNLVRQRIEKHVADTCSGSFTSSYIGNLSNWLDTVVMLWIRLIYSAETVGVACSDQINATLANFRQRLAHFLYETYTRSRIDQLFDIIIEFPESQPAVEDLKECLEKTDLRSYLTKTLKNELETRLLILGVDTTNILTAYIAAIRALRVLDPSGVLLEIVCEPVRKYLRTRDDTVRCIVQSLIDDNTNELAEELQRNEGLCLDDSFVADDLNDPDELEKTWQLWRPDPIDADPSKLGHSRKRSSDIISMLVNIYGSKELFVNEYRTLLSNRLLSQFTYDTEREIRNLELLKLRFGEASLHQVEVMLKDISDSKRINNKYNESAENSATAIKFNEWPVNAIIVSAQFWPQFKSETLELPEDFNKGLEAFTKSFETQKGNRTLVWKNHLGSANIDLEIGGKKINLNVPPMQAAIIFQFQLKSEWSVEELSKSLKVPLSTVRRKMAFWQGQGLVQESSPDHFKLIEEGPMRRMSGIASNNEADMHDDESESVTRNSSDQRTEELAVFWNYITNMLINLESLPLDRIFQMLKMFAPQGPSAVEIDMEELRSFLDEKVRQHELLFSGGQYRLPKT